MKNTKKQNKNDIPIKNIKEIDNEVLYANFHLKDYFIELCNLIPNIEKEKIEIEAITKEKMSAEGFVYVIVVDKKILKIGQSITNITKRIQSYNCGKQSYRDAGTCSTTNYWILQTLLNLNLLAKVYAFFPEPPTYFLFGKQYKNNIPITKKAENEILNSFINKFGKKPIGCIQT